MRVWLADNTSPALPALSEVEGACPSVLSAIVLTTAETLAKAGGEKLVFIKKS